jgi:hypothetical protein
MRPSVDPGQQVDPDEGVVGYGRSAVGLRCGLRGSWAHRLHHDTDDRCIGFVLHYMKARTTCLPWAHPCIKALRTIVLVTTVWVLAFAIGTGITAFSTPWDELEQGVE